MIYDIVIETQGLIKSALVFILAKKSKCAIVSGLGNAMKHSSYEPMARNFIRNRYTCPSNAMQLIALVR